MGKLLKSSKSITAARTAGERPSESSNVVSRARKIPRIFIPVCVTVIQTLKKVQTWLRSTTNQAALYPRARRLQASFGEKPIKIRRYRTKNDPRSQPRSTFRYHFPWREQTPREPRRKPRIPNKVRPCSDPRPRPMFRYSMNGTPGASRAQLFPNRRPPCPRADFLTPFPGATGNGSQAPRHRGVDPAWRVVYPRTRF